jgi:hypothetical protein
VLLVRFMGKDATSAGKAPLLVVRFWTTSEAFTILFLLFITALLKHRTIGINS